MNDTETPGTGIGQWLGRHPEAVDIFCIAMFAVLCFGRLLLLRDVNVDDNCWLLAVYNTRDLAGFLDTGFRELRRVPQGIFLYGLFVAHTFFKDPVFIWQGLNLVMQALSAVWLYFLVRTFTGGRRLCAFAAACFFLMAPVDTTLPIFSNITTRTGVLLSMISLWCTARAVHSGKRRLYYFGALITALFTNYFLVEAAVSLEPGRFVMLLYMFLAGGQPLKDSLKKSALMVLPFILLFIPLAVYKTLYKPCGIYGGYYETGLKLILQGGKWKQVFKYFRFGNWTMLKGLIDGFPLWPALLGAAGGLTVLLGSSRFPAKEAPPAAPGLRNLDVFILGVVLLVFPVMFYMYAGKIPAYGHNTRHGIMMQIGNAVMLGGLLGLLFRKLGDLRSFKALFALLFAAGAFFTNVNLDQYFKTWRHKQLFWRAFSARFPVLPERADFIFDVDTSGLLYRYYADYDYEYPLNMLYARSTERGEIRKYRVIPAEEFAVPAHAAFTRPGHYGQDVFDTRTLIPVAFRNGRLYVGKEARVLENISYKLLTGNPVPAAVPGGAPAYPLHGRLKGHLP